MRSNLFKIHEKRDKRGKVIISPGKRVATYVVKSLQDKLSKSNVTILMGTILNLCPLSYLLLQ